MTLEYSLLDSGCGRKLEQVGEFKLIRPALSAVWQPELSPKEWEKADAVFERHNASGGGAWKWLGRQGGRLPAEWTTRFSNLELLVKPTDFGHLGFFAEHRMVWERLERLAGLWQGEVEALNLFAYSGVGSLALARGGAKVCHLDAARGMIDWGRRNHELNPQVPNQIRWIVDDVMKFCQRELRRNKRYRMIVLDPPSFGRGAQGQVWKIEEQLPELLDICRKLLDNEQPAAVALSCHSAGFSPKVLERLLHCHFGRGTGECFEMCIPEGDGKRELPVGFGALWFQS